VQAAFAEQAGGRCDDGLSVFRCVCS